MRSKASGVILLSCLLFIVAGCGPAPKERLKDSGLFGEHDLVRMESFGAIQGSVSGSFFLSMNGSSDFQFYWSPRPGEIIATALPCSKFHFIVDDKKDTPTIEFVFTNTWLNYGTDNDFGNPDIYPNLNDFVLCDRMELARVRISMTTLEKEGYLPKLEKEDYLPEVK